MALRLPGKTERRLAIVILLTAIVPLAAAALLAGFYLNYASTLGFNPRVGEQLDRSEALYKDYANAIKDDLRHQTDAIASDPALREAARAHDRGRLQNAIDDIFPRFPQLSELRVVDTDGNVVAKHDRGRPIDPATERRFPAEPSSPKEGGDAGEQQPTQRNGIARTISEDPELDLLAAFAVGRERVKHLDEVESTAEFVAVYHNVEDSRWKQYRLGLLGFIGYLGVTMVLTVTLGILLARGVTRRIGRLAAAINLVAEGDLSVRVPVTGSDEFTELASTFNRMLGEMVQSRARIEYLQRIGAWQEMAKRLAHEIKNPLTPIQLAVQECHRKFHGDDPKYRALLDTTLEIVEEEVGTLRRLVGNFSSFARMPHAELTEQNLREFLRECSEQLGHLDGEAATLTQDGSDSEPLDAPNVTVTWKLPDEPLTASIDRQMLRRVLVNLVRNAVQAIRDSRARRSENAPVGHVVVSAHREEGGATIEIEDDGPGIAEEAVPNVFDPYFTTKADGTGLGLAIVKKIVVEHNGSIEAGKSPLGGARFVIHLPEPGSIAAASARGRASRAELSES